MTVEVNIKKLLGAGAHFGHKTSRWHPKMAPYIFAKRQDAHIINLEKTVEALEKDLPKITELTKNGKKVLFVGTKKQVNEIVKDIAEEVKMPYVTARWVGGTLTNVETVNRQIRKLKDLEKKMESGELETRYSKLEVQRFQEEIDLLNGRYGGIKDMTEQPAALIVADAIEDKNAIKEANILHIPVFALTDTNVDPTNIDYVIPMNDDALKAVELVLGYFADAIHEGKGEQKVGADARAEKRAEKMAEKRAKAEQEALAKAEVKFGRLEDKVEKAEGKAEEKILKTEEHVAKKVGKVEEHTEKKVDKAVDKMVKKSEKEDADIEKIQTKAGKKIGKAEDKADEKIEKTEEKAEKKVEKEEEKVEKTRAKAEKKADKVLEKTEEKLGGAGKKAEKKAEKSEKEAEKSEEKEEKKAEKAEKKAEKAEKN